MKLVFLIYGGLLTLGGLSAIPAIAMEVNSRVAMKPQIQVSSTRFPSRISQNLGAVRFETELLKLTNLERRKVGLAPLKLSSQLARDAQSHAADMANNNYFSHTGRNGSSIVDRAKAVGYKYSYLGENIAAGGVTPEETVMQWMNSSGHRANILNSKFTEIGFGYANVPSSSYKYYWVQVFGKPQR